MKRDAKYLEDSQTKMVRSVLEIIRDEYPERKQLGLFKDEDDKENQKLSQG